MGCEHLVLKTPPLQRSRVTGLRADTLGDLVPVEDAYVSIRSPTINVLIAVDEVVDDVVTGWVDVVVAVVVCSAVAGFDDGIDGLFVDVGC